MASTYTNYSLLPTSPSPPSIPFFNPRPLLLRREQYHGHNVGKHSLPSPHQQPNTILIFLYMSSLVAVGLILQNSTKFQIQLDSRGNPAVGFLTTEVPDEWKCNPFEQPGRLLTNETRPDSIVWKPYDEECEPSRLLKNLYSANKERSSSSQDAGWGSKLDYPWLVDATILLQGDSMERLHLIDFCNFVGGDLLNIIPSHPASPPTFRKQLPTIYDSEGSETLASIKAKEARRRLEDMVERKSADLMRPWVCDLKEWNATIVQVATWGMEDLEEVFHKESFYHGPATWAERFHHITILLLHNLATYLDRPQILHPTYIEISSGFWDLRAFTERDFIAAGIASPYPQDSPIPFGNIGEAREERWAVKAKEIVEMVARAFPGKKGVRDGPTITWRTLHSPMRNNYTPYSRAFALDQLARTTMHELRVESFESRPSSFYQFKKHLLRKTDASANEDLGLDERLRVSEIGHLLTGQWDHFMDFLHPTALPGSYLWGDMMLYELKRSVLGIGRR